MEPAEMGALVEERTIQEFLELIEAHRWRLHKLRVPMMGIDARPEDLIETEDIEKNLLNWIND